MPRYFKKEIADLNGTGEKQYRYELQSRGNIDLRGVANSLHTRVNSLSLGAIITLLQELPESIAYLLSEGYSVTLDSLGTFTTSLKLADYADETEARSGEPNARRLHVSDVNFRAHKSFVVKVDNHCLGHLHRDDAGIRHLRRSPYSREERVRLARSYIREHGFMRQADYVRLTGLSRTTACRELQAFCADAAAPLRSLGGGSHKVYVLGQE